MTVGDSDQVTAKKLTFADGDAPSVAQVSSLTLRDGDQVTAKKLTFADGDAPSVV